MTEFSFFIELFLYRSGTRLSGLGGNQIFWLSKNNVKLMQNFHIFDIFLIVNWTILKEPTENLEAPQLTHRTGPVVHFLFLPSACFSQDSQNPVWKYRKVYLSSPVSQM